MFAHIKKIKKPIRRQDFFLPSGDPVPPDKHFRQSRATYRLWKFKNLELYRVIEMAKDGELIFRRRVEIKVELRKSFRNDGKVSSKTWHLASILKRDITDPTKCEAFWNKVDDKLRTFELSPQNEDKIRAKIEAAVPRPNDRSSGQ